MFFVFRDSNHNGNNIVDGKSFLFISRWQAGCIFMKQGICVDIMLFILVFFILISLWAITYYDYLIIIR